METKKTPKANLESKRPTWLLVGYVTVLAFMFVAFEWTRDIRVDTSGRINENVFEQDMEIPLTRQPELTPSPPPQVTPINDVLTIIDDDATAEETNFASLEETGEDVVIKHIPVTVDEEVVVEDDIFVVVEENPQFPNGGTAGLLQYLGKNIKYPTIPQENGTQGRVTVQFVVNKDGSIVDVKVIRGVDPYLDKEAVRVISTMPKWIPGKQRGVPVALKDAGGEKEYAVMLQAMQTIHRRSKGLLGFVENYRRLTRLPAPVCASVSVRELFTDLQKLFPDETIHFELPPSEKILNVDRAQIEQVLINLLKNAREASGRREEPRIEVKAAFAPKVTSSLTSWRCTITVRDNGEGILPEVQDKIFVPFFTTKTAGSGIGLSLCKQIMNQHGGNISVYSEAGKGSCFT